MNSFDMLPTVCYISGLINEIKKQNESDREINYIHLLNIYEQISSLYSDFNDYYSDSIILFKEKMHDIIQNYKNDSNYIFLSDLEEIKKKLSLLMFMIGY